jgi:SAM-dependent methyltransferase
MTEDIRAEAAQYYDANPTIPDDIGFYQAHLPSAEAVVLELGCGTGRVLVPLVAQCRAIQGIDISEAMLARCRQKLWAAGIPPSKAQVTHGDITHFALGRTFDLIIAPYRVFQLLETDAQVDGLLRCVREHLAPGGTCILNVVHLQQDPVRWRQEWGTTAEVLRWEVPVEGGRLRCDERRPRMDPERRILYPELIYRRWRDRVGAGPEGPSQGDAWVETAVLKIPRRCYAPEEFAQLIRSHGFRIVHRWGGYAGEPYGEGPELVIEFAAAIKA